MPAIGQASLLATLEQAIKNAQSLDAAKLKEAALKLSDKFSGATLLPGFCPQRPR